MRSALICAAVFAVMVGAAFAAVPFYRAFCQATGFNGATRRGLFPSPPALAGPAGKVTVRFDTNVRGLPWRFTPDQPSQVATLGQSKLAFFRATNTGDKPLTGRALYNVLPEAAGPYFSKLECFCFKNQTLAPGETAEFPVVYFIDPRFARDPDVTSSGQITLSYTFFPARPEPEIGAAPASPRAALGGGRRPGL